MSPLWSFLLTLAYCLPVLILVVPLLARRYVGGRALERRIRRGRRAPAHGRAASDPPSRHRLVRGRRSSGPALLAASLAGRAPPGL